MNQILHERVVLLSTGSADRPRVPDEERVTVLDLGRGLYRVLALFGFMEQPRVDEIAACSAKHGLVLDVAGTDFLIATDAVRATGHAPMARWRKRLFAILLRLAPPPTASLGIPPERVILLGREVEL